MNKPHIDKPRWTPEFSWSGVVSLATLFTVLTGGIGFLWVSSSAWANVLKDVEILKEQTQAQAEYTKAVQKSMDDKMVRVQELTERRLEIIHTDVQAIKNILIQDRSSRRD